MNLAQLRYFQKLANIQHYSRAAKELNIAQPSLSSSISSLEKELDVPLFQKVGRNVRLTKYGREFLSYIDEGLERIDAGTSLMKEYSGIDAGGRVDIGCIMTVQASCVPRIIRAYKESIAANTTFSIREETSLDLLEGLRRSLYDAAFLAKGSQDETIEYIPIARQKVVIGVNEQSPLSKQVSITCDDLKLHDSITYETSIPLGQSIHRMLNSAGVKSVSYSYLDENILAGFAATGPKPAVLLDTVYAPSIDGLVLKDLTDQNGNTFYHQVYFAFDRKRRHPRCVEKFIDFVATQCTLESPLPHEVLID